LINKFIDYLKSKFEVSDKGSIEEFLGLSIDYNRDRGEMKIDQTRYINSLFDKFNMIDCKPVQSPIAIDADILIEVADNEIIEPDLINEFQ
jgi:hypothetical protein